jgi:hypothetical protein
LIELNNVEEPFNFKIKTKYIKTNNLPTGIEKHRQKYRYQINGKYSYVFNTIEEALNDKNKIIEKEKKEKSDKISNEPILRNLDGIPIINVIKNNLSTEIMVDAHRYYELKFLSLNHINTDYITICKNDDKILLSRYLLNCNDKNKYVDHKDGNIFNYQMNNLRIITPTQNAQNKNASKNSTSSYVGVCNTTKDNKWRASIYKRHKSFNTEYEAVMYRDMLAYEFNLSGDYYKINLPEELQVNLFIKSLSEDNFNFQYLFY